MAKAPRTTRETHRTPAQPPAAREGSSGPPEPRPGAPVRRRPKGWLQAIAERFGAFPAED